MGRSSYSPTPSSQVPSGLNFANLVTCASLTVLCRAVQDSPGGRSPGPSRTASAWPVFLERVGQQPASSPASFIRVLWLSKAAPENGHGGHVLCCLCFLCGKPGAWCLCQVRMQGLGGHPAHPSGSECPPLPPGAQALVISAQVPAGHQAGSPSPKLGVPLQEVGSHSNQVCKMCVGWWSLSSPWNPGCGHGTILLGRPLVGVGSLPPSASPCPSALVSR